MMKKARVDKSSSKPEIRRKRILPGDFSEVFTLEPVRTSLRKILRRLAALPPPSIIYINQKAALCVTNACFQKVHWALTRCDL